MYLTVFTKRSWQEQQQAATPARPKKTFVVSFLHNPKFLLDRTTLCGGSNLIESLPQDKSEWYRTFQIPKRNGKMRTIKEPLGSLKPLQAYIANQLNTYYGIKEHDAAHGFVKGRGTKSAMLRHQQFGSKYFAKFDFSNFFPSISKELLMLRLFDIAQINIGMPRDYVEYWVDFLVDETGHMTQGCISTPYIANILMTRFDAMLTQWCEQHDLCYTRYADDIQISGKEQFNYLAVQSYICWLLETYYPGIKLNKEKTQYRSYKGHNYMLGICYNQEQNLTVGYKAKNTIKVIAHKISIGDTEGIDTPHWKGLLSYYTMVEPEYFRQPRFNPIREAD